jgi:hypothetical protein
VRSSQKSSHSAGSLVGPSCLNAAALPTGPIARDRARGASHGHCIVVPRPFPQSSSTRLADQFPSVIQSVAHHPSQYRRP